MPLVCLLKRFKEVHEITTRWIFLNTTSTSNTSNNHYVVINGGSYVMQYK
jgi:hypothetical protein